MVRLYTDAFLPAQKLRDEFDRVFRSFFGERPGLAGTKLSSVQAYPAINLWEEEHAIKAEAEVPGLKSDHLEVAVHGSELRIEGQFPDPEADEGAYHRRERAHGPFRRVVRLPIDVDADKVEATLRDGVLLVTLPKAAAALPRKIKVAPA